MSISIWRIQKCHVTTMRYEFIGITSNNLCYGPWNSCMGARWGPSGQLQSLSNHDSNPIKHLVQGSVAHEGAGGHQLVLLVNMRLFHVCVDVLAAHGLQGACRLGVGPPGWGKRRTESGPRPWTDERQMTRAGGRTHMSPSVSRPTVSSQPGSSLAARTGEMQHMPSGFPAPWKSLMSLSTSEWTLQSWFFTAQSLRFFATPKPPARKVDVKKEAGREGREVVLGFQNLDTENFIFPRGAIKGLQSNENGLR